MNILLVIITLFAITTLAGVLIGGWLARGRPIVIHNEPHAIATAHSAAPAASSSSGSKAGWWIVLIGVGAIAAYTLISSGAQTSAVASNSNNESIGQPQVQSAPPVAQPAPIEIVVIVPTAQPPVYAPPAVAPQSESLIDFTAKVLVGFAPLGLSALMILLWHRRNESLRHNPVSKTGNSRSEPSGIPASEYADLFTQPKR